MAELAKLKTMPGMCYFELSDALVVQMTEEAQENETDKNIIWAGERLPAEPRVEEDFFFLKVLL